MSLRTGSRGSCILSLRPILVYAEDAAMARTPDPPPQSENERKPLTERRQQKAARRQDAKDRKATAGIGPRRTAIRISPTSSWARSRSQTGRSKTTKGWTHSQVPTPTPEWSLEVG